MVYLTIFHLNEHSVSLSLLFRIFRRLIIKLNLNNPLLLKTYVQKLLLKVFLLL